MVFRPPSWVPPITVAIPDSVPVGEFALNQTGRTASSEEETAFVDGISGTSYAIKTVRQRVEHLARGLGQRLGWSPDSGSPWDKVVAIYSLNTIDYFVLCWAVHRLNGICLPLHPTSTAEEITTHLTKARCRLIFTCRPLMPTCRNVAGELSIPSDRIFTIAVSDQYMYEPALDGSGKDKFQSLEELVIQGSQLAPFPPLQWDRERGRSQVAYFCATSGTSGKQKLAMLTHYGLITNLLQIDTFEGHTRAGWSEVATGAVPYSHAYGIMIGLLAAWRGDTLITFPRFDMQRMLQAVPIHKIQRLYLVPPILAALDANPFFFELCDLSSVTTVVTGAAPLHQKITESLNRLQPSWKIMHGYGKPAPSPRSCSPEGLTESCVIATCTSPNDIWPGSSGSVMPEFRVRLVGPDEQEITGYEQPGEIRFQSPSLFIGYLDDSEATSAAFDRHGWLRTGDVGLFRQGPQGTEHLFVIDRMKDLIKVKGNQVLPGDIEQVLLAHPSIVAAAVVGVPDDLAGERPFAFLVRSSSIQAELSEVELTEVIEEHVHSRLDETHWVDDRIRFLPALPTSGNGKVLKKALREMVTMM
ncbi:4-coumarate--CoA ligase-like 2 [Aspergillus udagawae]|uniref:4-coumarate--CoA ligase-like 2 n=1 Tax=Aspergillus udagawae TaxID=91492 RepID=A0A8H3XRD9_9EURO|nr:4-coumarate--CoA ligase-like 2 [Aspergillus udagawae]